MMGDMSARLVMTLNLLHCNEISQYYWQLIVQVESRPETCFKIVLNNNALTQLMTARILDIYPDFHFT